MSPMKLIQNSLVYNGLAKRLFVNVKTFEQLNDIQIFYILK